MTATVETRIAIYKNGIDSAQVRLAQIEADLVPLLEERDSLIVGIARWDYMVATLSAEVPS